MDRALVRWCIAVTAPAAAYAAATLAALAGLECDGALAPRSWCVWWGHSWLPTVIGLPACLAFGAWMSTERRSRRPVVVAGLLVVATCVYLRAAAGHA